MYKDLLHKLNFGGGRDKTDHDDNLHAFCLSLRIRFKVKEKKMQLSQTGVAF